MLEELQTYIVVIEKKSFTRAAESLNISQPTVSLHIKRLEEHFQERFILRSKKQKKLIITDAGEKLYIHAKKILEMWDLTRRAIKEETTNIKGTVNIGASLTIGEYFLPEFLGLFNSKYPDIKINIELGNTEKIGEELEEYRIDVGIVEGILVNEKFVKEHLYRDKLVVIAANEIDELIINDDVRWIVREKGSGTRMQWDFIMGENITKLKYSPITMNTNFSVKEAVKNNLGVALISEYIAQIAAANNEVKIIECAVQGSRYFDLILQKNREYDEAKIVFCDEIRKFLHEKQCLNK